MPQQKKSVTASTSVNDHKYSEACTNVVVLVGQVVTEPVDSELPNGNVVTNCDVSTVTQDGRTVVPVVLYDVSKALQIGDEICAVGFVRKRFYRTGGGVHSRTEVVVQRSARVRQKAQMRRLLEHVADDLLTMV